MEMRFETGSVVGKKTDTHWAQVIKTRHAFGVIELEDEEGNAQSTGMQLVHRITALVSEPISSVQDVISGLEQIWDPGIRTLLLCIPVEHTITVMLRGVGAVYLKRDGHIARLRNTEGIISGHTHPEDIIFLSSKTCLNGISEDEFFTFFDHLGVEEIAEKLTLHLHKTNGAAGYAGLFVGVKGEEGQPKPTVQNATEDGDHGPTPDQSPKSVRHVGLPGLDLKAIGKKTNHAFRLLRRREIKLTTILLVLFFASVVFGLMKERSGKTSTETYNTVEEGKRLYDEGVALLDLNAVKSKERLIAAKTLVEKAKEEVSPKTKEGRMLADLEKTIDEVLPKATKEYRVTPELFFDVSLLKTGAVINSFALYEDTMAFLDVNSKTVFYLQLSTKNGQIVGGGASLDGSQSVAIHGTSVYVLTPAGIHVFNTQDKSMKPLVIRKAADWLTIKSMVAYAGNIYLMDTGKSRIWKYVATGSAFTDMREYLLPDFFPDLSKASNMAIDGSVWLGTTTGTVTRFTQGKDDTFVPKGVEPPLGTSLKVFTDDMSARLYVLDASNHRVVVMEKDGMYVGQYIYPDSFSPFEIAASESLKKLFFFSQGKLYTTPLQ